MSLRIFVDMALTPDALKLLREATAGHELVFPLKPASSVLHKGESDVQVRVADVAFGQPDPKGIAGAAKLKWVHISSSGVTRYDNAEFRALVAGRKIAVSNSAGVFQESCAMHALSFMVAQSRELPAALKSRAENGSAEWNALRGSCVPLGGQTVLIAGFGTIGRRLAELLEPFGMEIIAYRRKSRGDEGVPVITDRELAETLSNRADHVVDILPDSAETRHFFNGSRFAMMKPGAVFYNIGRGGTVDQDALLKVLRSRHLKAAWLDVTEPEPLPEEHPLRKEPNCFITPHTAGGHFEETKSLVRHFLANLKRFEHGDVLMDRVM